jgi:hypothetical protein
MLVIIKAYAARLRNPGESGGHPSIERNRERASSGEIFIEMGQTCRERSVSGIERRGRPFCFLRY